MRVLTFIKDHPFGALAFVFAVVTGVVAEYVYDELRPTQEETTNDVNRGTAVISINRVPSQGSGDDSRGVIAGTVSGITNPGEYRITVYALTDHWYVQPTRDESLTLIGSDGTWATETHLGTSYAALLVGSAFNPPPQPESLPRGSDVFAFITVGADVSP